jgi:cytochrome c-type biogenesis protein CcmH/NrfF
LADAFLFVGFGLFVAGVALWSIPAALCVAGAVVFVTGRLQKRADTRGER